jgi:hypothetical protein
MKKMVSPIRRTSVKRKNYPSWLIEMGLVVSLWTVLLVGVTQFIVGVVGCNEAVCASIVSKCTLTQACKCELKNCSCCRECFDCLTYLYDECCSCVGKDFENLSKASFRKMERQKNLLCYVVHMVLGK